MTKTGFMFFMLLVFCLGQVFAAPCGDVNSSGSIDIVDALLTAQHAVGLNPSNFDSASADVNGDSSINIVDALLIARFSVGLITSLPGCVETPVPTSVPTAIPTPVPTTTPASPPASGNNIYASPSGSLNNGGTSFSDALDIKTALERVSAGQTLLLQAGTYGISYSSGNRNTMFLTRSGSSSNLIRVEGYNGQAKLDFQCPEGDWVQDSWGFEVTGNYWYFKNIDITRAAYQGAYVMGSHNTFENCNSYDNRNTGLEINEGGAYTTVINCDAYNNYDPKKNGGMADGFAAKQEQGQGNKFIGCDAWGNSDDGYDNFDSPYKVIYENCTGNSNGTHDGNGNGFKLGGNDVTAHHELTNCVANNNRKHGFHANSNPGPIYLTNCSASGNGGNDFTGDFVIQ
jgi:hypothetical protein